jgi:hypothetical protein
MAAVLSLNKRADRRYQLKQLILREVESFRREQTRPRTIPSAVTPAAARQVRAHQDLAFIVNIIIIIIIHLSLIHRSTDLSPTKWLDSSVPSINIGMLISPLPRL